MIVRRSRSHKGAIPLDSEQTKRSVSANISTSQQFTKTGCITPPRIMFVKPLQTSSRCLSHSLESSTTTIPSSLLVRDLSQETESSFCLTSSMPSNSTNSKPPSLTTMQVHEFLFLGNTETAMNTRYIYQKNVSYFVKISVNSNASTIRWSRLSTSVPQVTRELHSVMIVPYREEMPLEDLLKHFQAVNDLIGQARSKAKRVLVYSDDSLAVCQAFALAYNVQYYNLDFDRALTSFQRLNVKVKLNDFLRTALTKWADLCESNRKNKEITTTWRTDWDDRRPASDCAVRRIAWQ
ncbi:hypothetical protein KIN20_024011 [Parelaphostrongylus tenuis]|uniref:Tyrosine-protein phosphatase domain-containing protein n=1 Tax=Parelaphostrongylus tenuis TaxID=148309 RepID=A0AAD5N750_PARTN|nr:hypothetical protein KIN20_024011 [Parelaphostrongylus tenuis]